MNEKSRTIRNVAVADHLWDALAEMAHEMGCDRDALVNQALFMFARLNGFLDPGRPITKVGFHDRPATPRVRQDEDEVPWTRSAGEEGGPEADFGSGGATTVPSSRIAIPSSSEPDSGLDERAMEVMENIQFEDVALAEPARPPPLPEESIEGFDADVAEERPVIAASPEQATGSAGPSAETRPELHLVLADGKLERVQRDRFIIGRGKGCDLVVPSAKVSREHAVIMTEDSGEFFIEDLGSSNGTWFDNQRIQRRRLQDGDEVFVSSERLRCVIR